MNKQLIFGIGLIGASLLFLGKGSAENQNQSIMGGGSGSGYTFADVPLGYVAPAVSDKNNTSQPLILNVESADFPTTSLTTTSKKEESVSGSSSSSGGLYFQSSASSPTGLNTVGSSGSSRPATGGELITKTPTPSTGGELIDYLKGYPKTSPTPAPKKESPISKIPTTIPDVIKKIPSLIKLPKPKLPKFW